MKRSPLLTSYKSLKDIFRSSIKLDSKISAEPSSTATPKEQTYLSEKIAKAEKEIKKLEEKFLKSEGDEKDKIKKLIKMEETTLLRLNKELQKYDGNKGHTRMASAPVLTKLHSEDQGDEGKGRILK